MSKFTPDIKVRYLVATWPEDAARGAVTLFCRRHKVSRAWFYKIRAAAIAEGPMKAMETGSTKPDTSPARVDSVMVELALATRESLKQAGYDHGPLSVASRLRRQGVRPPSRASLARIFTRAGVVVPAPRKKPRSAYQRFVYPEPNGCWQIDSTQWLLAGGAKVAIFQLVDDHSRLALASLVAGGETSEAAIRVVKTAIGRHGVPQKFLSDNGSAFNPTRMGRTGALVEYLKSLGVQPITGKPYKPTTQGKNERFHQTLFRYLDKQPLAATLAELQAQVDAFDRIYNTDRPHQGLPGRVTPQAAWDATAKVDPPRPQPDRPRHEPPVATAFRRPRVQQPAELPNDTMVKRLSTAGTFRLDSVIYLVGGRYGLQHVLVVTDGDALTITDLDGEILIEHTRPAPGVTYVGNGRPPGTPAKTPEVSPKS